MVVSNRNLLFQGSIFRAMLVSGGVVLNSPEFFPCLNDLNFCPMTWPELHLEKCNVIIKEWHVPSLFPQTLPQPKKHQHRFRFYPNPKPTPNLCFFSFCALPPPKKTYGFLQGSMTLSTLSSVTSLFKCLGRCFFSEKTQKRWSRETICPIRSWKKPCSCTCVKLFTLLKFNSKNPWKVTETQ